MSSREINLNKNMSNDREIILQPKEGFNTLDSKGGIDNRLFKGTNKLRAILDTDSSLWHLKLDAGLLPAVFQQRYTTFDKVLAHVKDYYDKRNVEIKEVIY